MTIFPFVYKSPLLQMLLPSKKKKKNIASENRKKNRHSDGMLLITNQNKIINNYDWHTNWLLNEAKRKHKTSDTPLYISHKPKGFFNTFWRSDFIWTFFSSLFSYPPAPLDVWSQLLNFAYVIQFYVVKWRESIVEYLMYLHSIPRAPSTLL